MKSQADYAAYRKVMTESGERYQDFIVDLFSDVLKWHIQQYTSRAYQYAEGESRQRIEIKHDMKYATSGNLYVELQEKAHPRPGSYVDSGINRDSVFYV